MMLVKIRWGFKNKGYIDPYHIMRDQDHELEMKRRGAMVREEDEDLSCRLISDELPLFEVFLLYMYGYIHIYTF
jgi:hypothetical protein